MSHRICPACNEDYLYLADTSFNFVGVCSCNIATADLDQPSLIDRLRETERDLRLEVASLRLEVATQKNLRNHP